MKKSVIVQVGKKIATSYGGVLDGYIDCPTSENVSYYIVERGKEFIHTMSYYEVSEYYNETH